MKTLMVVDGMNMLFRGYYATAYADKMKNADGNPTNAIKGFINILLADIDKHKPTHCAVVFDRPGKTFRHKLYPEYKANRTDEDGAGAEIKSQIPALRKLLIASGIPVFGYRNIEGDDVVGTIAKALTKDVKRVIIVSRDKDFAQLVDKRILLDIPKEGLCDSQGVVQKWGVKPSQIIDYLCLVGDSIDNIPGVRLIGAKTAAQLLSEYGSLANIYKNINKLTPSKRKNLQDAKDWLSISKQLVTIDTEAIEVSLEDTEFRGIDHDALESICRDLAFHQTLNLIRKRLQNVPAY